MDRARRFERAHADRLHRAIAGELAARQRARLLPPARLEAGRISGPASNVPVSIRFKRAGNMSPMRWASASHKARRCCGAATFSKADGGIRALGAEIAEDAAATKVIRSLGLHVRLVDTPFEQPLGRRSLREVWSRQVRWARLRRSTFPLCFAPEIFTGALLPMLAGAYAALHYDINCALVVALIATIWYLPQILLTLQARMASFMGEPDRHGAARHSPSDGLDRCLADRRFRLARQRHERARGGRGSDPAPGMKRKRFGRQLRPCRPYHLQHDGLY